MSLYIDPSTWNLATAWGIPYKLVEGYPQGSWSEDEGQVTEKYIIEGSRLNEFIQESFSNYYVIPGLVWWSIPARSYPGAANLRTRGISFEPFPPGKPGDPFAVNPAAVDGTYAQFVQVTIEYATCGKNDGDDQDILEVSCNATGEFLMLPPKRFKNEPDDAQIRNPILPITKVLPGLEWSAKFKRIPRTMVAYAVNLFRSLLGKVNSLPMPIFAAVDVETILFVGFGMSYKWTWRDSQPFVEVDMKFLEKKVVETTYSNTGAVTGTAVKGHNHFYDPEGNNGQGMWLRPYQTIGSTKRYVYESANLNQMFY